MYRSRRSAFRPFAIRRIVFLVQPRDFSTLPTLDGVTCVSNSSSTKSTISSRYRSGFSSKYSHRESNIGGVMLRGRPTPFDGALVEPKWRRFDCIVNTERSLQPTTSAISAGGWLLRIMSRICACCDSARFGAILGIDLQHFGTSHLCPRCDRQGRWHVPEARAHLIIKPCIGASPCSCHVLESLAFIEVQRILSF